MTKAGRDGRHRGRRRDGGGDVVLRRHAGLLDDGRLAVGGLPGFLAQLNLGVLALVVNVLVTGAVSAATRGAAPVEGARTADAPRFSRAGQPALQRTPQS